MGSVDAGRTRTIQAEHGVQCLQGEGRAYMSSPSISQCKPESGTGLPVVTLKRCEGKGDCERVCPENVFEVRRIDDADYAQLGALQKFKLRVHGMKFAYT